MRLETYYSRKKYLKDANIYTGNEINYSYEV